MYIVYKTINLVNGKIYIGYHHTQNLKDQYLGSGKILKRAIEKYGSENFLRQVLASFSSKKEASKLEAELVNKEFLKSGISYNIKNGGIGGWDHITVEQKRKGGRIAGNKTKNLKIGLHSPFNTKTRWTKENHPTPNKNGKVWTGRRHKEESKKLIGMKNSVFQKGKSNSQFGTIWITNGLESVKMSGISILDGWTKGRKLK